MVQAAHAAQESGLLTQKLGLAPSSVSNLVLCQAADESFLLREAERLKLFGINHVLFREPDMGNQATSLCTIPLIGEPCRLFKKWKLWDYHIPGVVR
ncbi:hypothetical protein CCP1ISM_90018 [Azospirillaceae bacterium]